VEKLALNLDKILLVGMYRWRYHLCKIRWWSINRFGGGRGSNFTLPL